MFTKNKDDERQKKEIEIASKFFKATNIEERLVSQTKAISIKNDREMELEDSKVVPEINERIKKADSKKGDPYEDAISWEEFFMGIAILSKKRPGQHDKIPGKAVKSKTQLTYTQVYNQYIIKSYVLSIVDTHVVHNKYNNLKHNYFFHNYSKEHA